MHEWRTILELAADCLGQPISTELEAGTDGKIQPHRCRSSSTFILHWSLSSDAVYIRGELPLLSDLQDYGVRDFSWASQGPIGYDEIAHLIIPRFFTEEYDWYSQGLGSEPVRAFTLWRHQQNLRPLSEKLTDAEIQHNFCGDFLEIKRF